MATVSYTHLDVSKRQVGYCALTAGADPSRAEQVAPLLKDLQLELRYVDGVQRVFANGEDVSERIRTPEVSMAASAVSALPEVRAFLLQLQRDTAVSQNVIMDGRDIGTVVLPKAGLKVFLTASPEDRATRRYMELKEKGVATTFEEVLADMIKRDYDDSHREAAPLKPADDAILVDTTGNTLEQSVEVLKKLALEAIG